MKKVFLIFTALLFMGCSSVMKGLKTDKAVKIIFDTDMGNDIDDGLALDMLYKYVEDGKVDLLAITSNKKESGSTEYLDIMNNFYGFPNVPIGKITDGPDSKKGDHFAFNVSQDKSYKRSIKDYDKIPESVDLLRKTLQKHKNNSVVIVAVGFSSNLSRLLDSKPDDISPLTGKELIAKKVKYLCMMAGDFRPERKHSEYNVRLDKQSAQNVFKNWPTKIVTSPFEVGLDIKYPGSSISKDFTYVKKHPLVKGYEAFAKMPYDRQTWDLTSVLYAVEGDGNGKYFSLSSAGNIEVQEDSKTVYEPSAKGNRYYLKVNEEQKKAVANRFLEIITRVPKVLEK
ncbi:nucleoside hydrolase [Pseudopedobacter beijingensis]|uniref:Nucleoside hydrolase n=1 Tax=Pseudopedobacter beijingensis TaxID=1207056 RepID=A0ABW4I965_9SPHI